MKKEIVLRQPESYYPLSMQSTFNVSDIVVGTIIRLTFDYFEVDLLSTTAILPIDELSIHHFDNQNNWRFVGKKIVAKVTSFSCNGTPILSRRTVMLKSILELKQGDIIDFATVISVCHFAVFLDIGNGVTAMLHVSNFFSSYFSNIESFINIGDVFRVQIISIEETEFGFKICVSRKTLFSSLEEDPNQLYVGDVVKVRISNPVDDNGYFCEISPAISGIVNSSATLEEGELISAIVCKITPKGVKLSHMF